MVRRGNCLSKLENVKENVEKMHHVKNGYYYQERLRLEHDDAQA